MNSENALDKTLKLRVYFLMTSKILGILTCLYFIINFKNYEINWNILTWFFPEMAARINYALSFIGTLILIIPLTLIIISLFITNNMKLNFAVSFFGISTTLFTILSGVVNNTLTSVYNFKFFVVLHKLTVTEKREIFIREYKQIIVEEYSHIVELYKKLQDAIITSKFNNVYDLKLSTLSDTIQIQNYAREVIINIVDTYNNNLNNLNKLYYFKVCGQAVLIITGITIVGFIAIAGIRYFFFETTEPVIRFAEAVVETTHTAARQSIQVVDNMEGTRQITDIVHTTAEGSQRLLELVKYSLAEIRRLTMENKLMLEMIKRLFNEHGTSN